MELKQLDFDFSARVENNHESIVNLRKQAAKFNAQCQKVYDLLMSGKRLTCLEALVKYGIGHLPRRIKDLKDAEVPVQDEWKDKEGVRYKEYFIEKESPTGQVGLKTE